MTQSLLKQLSRRTILQGLGSVSAGMILSDGLIRAVSGSNTIAHAAEGTINWLTWSIYQLPEIMSGFNEKFGIKVNPITFEDNAEGFLKVKNAGGKLYDVTIGDGFWPLQFHQEGLIEPIDLDSMPNAKSLAPVFRNLKIWQQPDGKMLLFPNQWGIQPITYRKGVVPSFDSWEVLWDPKFKGRILQMDRPSEYITCVAIYLGIKDPFNMTDDELQAVKKKLMEQRPLIKAFFGSASDFVQAMALGEGDLGFTASPGIVDRIREAGGGEFGYVIPKEGTVGWADGSMLVSGSQNREATLKWINYFGSPETQATLAVNNKYAVTSESALKLLEERGHSQLIESGGMKNWQAVEKLTLLKVPSNIEKWTQIWNEYKAG